MEDCAGICDGDSEEDACGDCNGTATDPSECVQEGYMLSFGAVDLDSGSLEIIMNNEFKFFYNKKTSKRC